MRFVAKRVLVAGASGFTGALAARLIWRHPEFELAAVTARADAGRRLDEVYPRHRVPLMLEQLDLDRHAEVDAAVIAYPHGASAPLAADLLERGVRVVDLGADFRLRDRDTYEQWYVKHPKPELIGQAVYGMPERYREQIAAAQLVACPGCYPTAALLALAPLAAAGVIADVVIDAKSGISGSGRTPTDETHFVSADENVIPYGIGHHRHMPEIDQELAVLGAPLAVTFTPHLVPLDQGELVSCYVTPSRSVSQAELDDLYSSQYSEEPFVELLQRPPGVREVRETNLCAIHACADDRTGKLLVFAAIDNLWKGSSGQAVQCLNLMFGLDETAGLL